MKKKSINGIITFVFCLYCSIAFTQMHYVVIIDRVNNNSKTYKELVFKNGKGIEKELEIGQTPIVKKGDLITYRLINFNELIYGFEIKNDLIKKPKTIASQLAQDNLLTKALFSTSPAALMLSGILQTPPYNINSSRGTDDQYSEMKKDIRDNYSFVIKKINNANNQLVDMIEDEGTTKDKLLEKFDELKNSFDPQKVKDNLNSIKNKISEIPNSDRDNDIKTIDKNTEKLLSNADNDFLKNVSNFYEFENIINSIDFQVEKTVIVGGELNPESSNNWNNGSEYDKFSTEIVIYKRANPIVTLERFNQTMNKPYDFTENEKNGDDVRQILSLDFKTKYKNRLYWTISVLGILLPSNKFDFAIKENSSQDSFLFKSHSLGANRIAIGTEINYEIPYHFKYVTALVSLGAAASFSNSKSETGSDSPIDKTYITSAIGIKSKKYSFFNIKLGAAWGKYQQLNKKYQSDLLYSYSTVTEEQKNSAISKKIIPSFFVALSFNL